MKTCSKCGVLKDLSDFGKNSQRRSGLQSRCKECINRYNRKGGPAKKYIFRDAGNRIKGCSKCNLRKPYSEFNSCAANPDKLYNYCKSCNSEVNRLRAEKFPTENMDNERMRRYGLSKSDYSKMIEEQKGACAICGRVRRMCVDHDHATGDVRALLCNCCNGAIALLQESPSIVLAAHEYLIKYGKI